MAIEKPVKDYLTFIQQNFNVSGRPIAVDLIQINNELKKLNINPGPFADTTRQIATGAIILEPTLEQRAADIAARSKVLNTIKDDRLFSRFEDITSMLTINRSDITSVHRAIKSLVYDLRHTREWLIEYKKLMESITKDRADSMEYLVILGKAILGRAVELCPIDTGLLRSSGVVVVGNGWIEIIFAAPYATYVHENLNNYHPVGRAKFLETALQEFLPSETVWVEIHGESIVYARITNKFELTYKHYD